MTLLALALGLAPPSWSASEKGIAAAIHLKPNMYDGLVIFRICAKCHYEEGWGQRSGLFPQLAGQHAKVTIKQLVDVRERNRETAGMDHFAMLREIGEPQVLADVAGYISSILMTPSPGQGAGTDLAHGEKLYNQYCAACHGEQGEGDNDLFYPRIQGQHYQYLLRQFKWIYRKERTNVQPGMVSAISDFTQRDTEAVLDYISRLKPPKEKLAPSVKWRNPDFE
ncbi:MAG: c-type cytochrome [Candidatus Polarisedimenticolaceae bacterium]|nr:c-type cytochrome [Candidatus Polarisedimenticolaceae bacterium]